MQMEETTNRVIQMDVGRWMDERGILKRRVDEAAKHFEKISKKKEKKC